MTAYEKKNTSLEVGRAYLIRCVTHYYVGIVQEITETDVVLVNASWIANTGRFHDFLKTGKPKEVEPFVHEAIVFRGGMIDATPWMRELPREQM